MQRNTYSYFHHPIILEAAKSLSVPQNVLWHHLLGQDSVEVAGESSLYQGVLHEIKKTFENGRWATLLHVFALSSMLNRKIITVYPDIPFMCRSLVHSVIQPIKHRNSPARWFAAETHPLIIFWTRDGDLSSARGSVYEPNHVVPVVMLPQPEVSTQSNMLPNVDIRRESEDGQHLEVGSPTNISSECGPSPDIPANSDVGREVELDHQSDVGSDIVRNSDAISRSEDTQNPVDDMPCANPEKSEVVTESEVKQQEGVGPSSDMEPDHQSEGGSEIPPNPPEDTQHPKMESESDILKPDVTTESNDCPQSRSRAFDNKNKKYTMEEKRKLGELCAQYKSDYAREVASAPLIWDSKRKRHIRRQPKEGYKSRAVRAFFPSLKDTPATHPKFKQAVSLANRCFESRKRGRDLDDDFHESPSKNMKKAFREQGGGRKPIAPEVRQAVFEWFIDIRGSLKGRLPKKIFKLKCEELFQKWVDSRKEPTTQKLEFSDHWIQSWMEEYHVSLLKPNKRFAIAQAERVTRIQEFLKNMWRVRWYFLHRYKKEPVVINGDQMPLHRNESASQKTMSIKGEPTFVKENYMLSRERVTVFTQVSSDAKHSMPLPEIVFKGKGTRIHLEKPKDMHVSWTPKGSYRLETMLETIKHLPNRCNVFSQKDYAIYVLDNYSVHVTEEVRKALLARGYILVCIGGGITGDVQVNDTHVHHSLKQAYRELEAKCMLAQLAANPKKIPAPSRDDMMAMLVESWTSLKIDTQLALKNNFLTNNFDGSEDYLVSDKLFNLVGEDLLKFRKSMLQQPPPASVKDLIQTITPPRGVKMKATQSAAPPDEGEELFDCEGPELTSSDLDHELEAAENESSSDLLQTSTCSTVSKSEAAAQQLPPECENTDIANDFKFLEELKKVFQENTTSRLFIPYFCQLKTTFTKARSSLKKRISLHQASMTAVSDHSACTSPTQPVPTLCDEPPSESSVCEEPPSESSLHEELPSESSLHEER